MKKLLLLTVMMASGVIGNVYAGSNTANSALCGIANNDVLEYGPKPGRPIPPSLICDSALEYGPRPGQPIPPVLVFDSILEYGPRPGRPRPPMLQK